MENQGTGRDLFRASQPFSLLQQPIITPLH